MSTSNNITRYYYCARVSKNAPNGKYYASVRNAPFKKCVLLTVRLYRTFTYIWRSLRGCNGTPLTTPPVRFMAHFDHSFDFATLRIASWQNFAIPLNMAKNIRGILHYLRQGTLFTI